MMVKKCICSIFGKIFLYTLLILLLVFGSLFLFFSNQIKSTITLTQQQQLSEVFMLFQRQIHEKSPEEIIALAEDFNRRNNFLEFNLLSAEGEVLYQTNNFGIQFIQKMDDFVPGEIYDSLSLSIQNKHHTMFAIPLENGMRLLVAGTLSEATIYNEVFKRVVWVFGLIFLFSLLAAYILARRIAKPIQTVSSDTHKMSQLLPVDPPKEHSDEIGQLSKDVYDMYSRLKSMIENQQYFFSAASHELKTPITAIGGIFEGMLEDVITQEEYPAYLREGIKIVKEQNKIVSEILELVKLNSELPSQEKEPLNLRCCIKKVLEQFSFFIESKEQILSVDVANDIICELNAGLFTKVLSNVLLNAIQNSPDGAEIRVDAVKKQELVQLSIWNGGTEIPENIITKIHEPFYRVNEARTVSEGRSGLGLAIVKKALDIMGLNYQISNADGGVLFHMDIS